MVTKTSEEWQWHRLINILLWNEYEQTYTHMNLKFKKEPSKLSSWWRDLIFLPRWRRSESASPRIRPFRCTRFDRPRGSAAGFSVWASTAHFEHFELRICWRSGVCPGARRRSWCSSTCSRSRSPPRRSFGHRSVERARSNIDGSTSSWTHHWRLSCRSSSARWAHPDGPQFDEHETFPQQPQYGRLSLPQAWHATPSQFLPQHEQAFLRKTNQQRFSFLFFSTTTTKRNGMKQKMMRNHDDNSQWLC